MTGTRDHQRHAAAGSGPYTVTADTGTGGGTLGLNLVDDDSIVDGVGNALGGPERHGNGNFTGQVYTIDKTAPTVSSVSATKTDGAYTVGELIPITVTFNESMVVTGPRSCSSRRARPTGAPAMSAGPGGATLTFNYTVQAGDTSSDLQYVSTSSLTLNGGTLTDIATNTATLTLPSLASGSSLAGSKAIVIDTTIPTLTSLQMLDVDEDGKVDRVTATFDSTLATYSAGTAPWTLANVPSLGTLASVSVAGAVATLNITEGGQPADTAVGGFTVALATSATGIRDTAGNQASFAATGPDDAAGPVPVSLTDTNGTTDGRMEAGNTLAVTFSEPIASVVSSPVTITETDPNGGGNDTLTIPGMTAGALDTGSNGYVSTNNASATFAGSTLVLSNGNKTLTATVGTTAGGTGTTAAGGPNAFVFTPSTALTDSAGNAAAGSFSVAAFRLF